jgi:hypothetical protein
MPTLEERIVSDIVSYIQQAGGDFSSWYVGIADDPRSSLFKDHNVDEASGLWIFDNAITENCARNAERRIIEENKTQGIIGGAGYTTTSVYAYKVTPTTRQ